MPDFRMPVLGADMEVGTVVEYLAKPGDHVSKGQPLAVIDTAKAAIEVESPQDAVLGAILVPLGEEVPVGTPLARLEPLEATAVPSPRIAESPTTPSGGEAETPTTTAGDGLGAANGSASPASRPSPVLRHLAKSRGVDIERILPTGPRGTVTRADIERADRNRTRVASSPLARAVARERGVDLAGLRGTGPDGAVLAVDVRAVVETLPAVPANPTEQARPQASGTDRSQRRQAAVADLMARSKREIPHFYLAETIDCGPLLEWLAEQNVNRPVSRRLLPAAALLRAAALAAVAAPELNGHWVDGPRLAASVDLGVAISLREGGLVAPAMTGAGTLPLEDVMQRLKDLVARARQGRLSGKEAGAPSLTVTNLGDLGVDTVFPIIYPPQLAMVGIGRIERRPWCIGDDVVPRPVVTLTLAVDHRAVNGHQAGHFLAVMAHHLTCPDLLLTSGGPR